MSITSQSVLNTGERQPIAAQAELSRLGVMGDGNDYSFLQRELERYAREDLAFSLPVSVIIPVFNRKQMLAKTLAAMTHQTYPKELVEVVVTDDGSSDGVEEVIDEYRHFFPIRHVYQEDEGYRLARARNRGIAAARYDQLVILDCDMIPGPDLLTSYLRYFHVTDHELLIGHRRFVCADAITAEDIRENVKVATGLRDIVTNNKLFHQRLDPARDWRLELYESSDRLRRHLFPFSASSGCNLAYSRRLFEAAGPYCEEFRHWGGEDMEWAYRVYSKGAYFVPVPEAVALHQEPPGGINETDRCAGEVHTNSLLEDLCPLLFRKADSGRRHRVPKVSILLESDSMEAADWEDIDLLLEQDFSDFEILVIGEIPHADLSLANARDARVRQLQCDDSSSDLLAEGIAACQGAYICSFPPQGFKWPDILTESVKYLDSHNVGLVLHCLESACLDESFGGSPPSLPARFPESLATTHQGAIFRKRDWERAHRLGISLEALDTQNLFNFLSPVCSVGQFSCSIAPLSVNDDSPDEQLRA